MRRALIAMLLCTTLLLGLVTGAASAHSMPVITAAGYQDVTAQCESVEDIPQALQSKVDKLRLEKGCYDLGYYKGQRYVLAAVGERRTGGYQVEFEQAVITDGTLYLNIAEIAPQGPAIQIITCPYLVLVVDAKFNSVDFWPEDESFEREKESTVAFTELHPAKLNGEQLELVEKLKLNAGGYIIERRDGHTVVLAALGQRPTAGYDVTVESMKEVNGALVIDAVEYQPEGLAAQVISYPYVLLYVHGEYSEVVVNLEEENGDDDSSNVDFEVVEKVPSALQSKISSLRREPGCHDLGWYAGARYVMVALGERPTAGYSVEVEQAVLDGDTLCLLVKEQEPKGSVIQIPTYPYTVIKLTADFEEVQMYAGDNDTEIKYVLLEDTDLSSQQRQQVAELKFTAGGYVLESQDGYTMVMIAAGQRPSTGYTLEVDSVRADDDVLLVDVIENKPTGPAAEVITYPYLVLYVAGEYDEARVSLEENDNHDVEQEVRVLGYQELSRELQQAVEQYKRETGCYVLERSEGRAILLIAAGERPSSGYALHIEQAEIDDDDELLIMIVEEIPKEAAAAVITYPYLVVEVSASYEEIEVYLNGQQLEVDEDRQDDDEKDYNYEIISIEELNAKQRQLVEELIIRRGAEIIAVEDHHTVVLLALGERSSSGYSLEILRVQSEGHWLLVDFREQAPEQQSAVLPVISYPYLLLRVKGSYSAVQMREVAAVFPPGLHKAREKVPDFLKDKFSKKIKDFKLKHPKHSRITIVVNGKELDLDVEPVFEKGQLLVPLRQVAEVLGAVVIWDGRDHSVTIQHGGITIKLYPDSRRVLVNGKRYRLEVGLRIKQGRSLVPLQFVAEILDIDMEWSEGKPLKLKRR